MTEVVGRQDGSGIGQTAQHLHVLVVGGGVIGIMCALALLRRGLHVTVVDKGIADQRCSFGNAGSLSPGSVAPLAMPGILGQVPGMLLDHNAPLHIRASYLLRAAPWLLRSVLESSSKRVDEISHSLHSLLGNAIDLYTKLLTDISGMNLIKRRGQLQLYRSRKAFEKDKAVWDLRKARGVRVESVDRDEIRQLEPAVGDHYTCGIYLPNEGMITNPAKLVELLTENFLRNGGKVVNATVSGFDIGISAPRAILTDKGPIGGDSFVIAAGAWSNLLTRQIGDDLPLQTQRGYHLTLSHPNIELTRPVVAADRKFFVAPLDVGLRIAGTVEFDSLESPPNYDRVRAFMAGVPRLFPNLEVMDGSMWMGHRPCMPDSLPVIDRSTRFGNVYYAFGNGHLGLTGAPMTADLIGDLVVGSRPAIDLHPFRVSRF